VFIVSYALTSFLAGYIRRAAPRAFVRDVAYLTLP